MTECENTDEQQEANRYIVSACCCNCHFCETCGTRMGWRLRMKLDRRADRFHSPYMVTLTVDPKNFSSPQDAFDYVRKHRCIWWLVNELHHRGYLQARDYFCVLEWQKDTEMPHWHLMLDARYIPKTVLDDLWQANRPQGLPPKEANRPGFGMVRYSRKPFQDHHHLVNYLTKYLIKFPEHGFPNWVLDYEGQIHRYTTSRGFFVEENQEEEPGPDDPGPGGMPSGSDSFNDPASSRRRRTPRERIAACTSKCNVIFQDESGNYTFSCSINMSWDEVATYIAVDPDRLSCRVSVAQVQLLERVVGWRRLEPEPNISQRDWDDWKHQHRKAA
ncbi:MAG: hypothetical protein JSS27_18900 [Planctomycetes bacterium]|nr:hypothetical protein [Planctomycetota bacterium]